jgi:hypothetical protein
MSDGTMEGWTEVLTEGDRQEAGEGADGSVGYEGDVEDVGEEAENEEDDERDAVRSPFDSRGFGYA